MHHPGPPQFVTVGDRVELAPRDPVPEATFSWRLARGPDDSAVRLGDDPVEHFEPDVPGTYLVELAAPDGEHELTIRAFPADTEGATGDSSSPVTRGEAYGSGPGHPVERTGRGDESTDDRRGRSGDATADDERGSGGGRPRVHLDAEIKGGNLVVEADCRPNPASDETPSDLDAVFLIDDRDRPNVPADGVGIEGTRLRVPIEVLPERLRVHAVAVGKDGFSVPDVVDVRRDAADHDDGSIAVLEEGVTVRRPYDPPAWATNACIYEIYVRAFAGEEEAAGSAFDAIRERLDYIAGLGIDALWLTPVLENDHAPHGYNITDFFAVASDLGSREDYERLVAAAHERDIKVLFDLVLNHSARTHPFFRDAVGNPDSEYHDWYEWQDPGVPGTYFDWQHIANFDFDELAVRRHLLDAVEEWAPLVDGFRCDMAWAVPNAFWREVHDRVKEVDPGFLLLDETIPYIPDFQAGLFDVHFDSTTAFTIREIGKGDQPADALLDAIEERTRVGFPDHAGFMLYAENHDEGRYVTIADRDAALAVPGALATLPGAPMVYAGQEFGQLGRRDDLVWSAADEPLREQYRRLLALRSEEAALQADADVGRIDYRVREGEDDRVVAYARVPEGATESTLGVVLNFGSDPAVVSLDAGVDSTVYADDALDDVGADSEAQSHLREDGRLAVEDVVIVSLGDGA